MQVGSVREAFTLSKINQRGATMTYPEADNASKWNWWYLQRLYDNALSESNIADITSYFIAVDQLLVPVQMIDPLVRRRIQELNDEGFIDGHLSDVSLTDAGCKYVEARRAPWPTKARRGVARLLDRPSISGAIAAIVVVLLTASGPPWWWKFSNTQSPPQQTLLNSDSNSSAEVPQGRVVVGEQDDPATTMPRAEG